MKSLPAAVAALVLLAGACHAEHPRPAPPPPVDDTCGASLVTTWLGALPTDGVKAGIAARVGERPIRYYGPNDAITMDYNPARLNVELGADGKIKRFRCG